MDFEAMTKDRLEEFGRTVGIELDRRLTKAVLIEQLNDHLANDELEDPVYMDAEIEEGDIPILPPIEYEVEFPAIEEAPVDPMIAIQAELDSRRHMQNSKEVLIEAQEIYNARKQRRIDCEVLEVESAEALDVAKDVAIKAELSWQKLRDAMLNEKL